MFKRSLALRIFAINFILLILPMVLLLGIFFSKNKGEITKDLLFHIRDIGSSRAELVSADMVYKQKILSVLIEQLDLIHPDKVKIDLLQQKLALLVHDAPELGSITYTQKNAAGRFILTASSFYKESGQDMSDFYFIQAAVERNQGLSLGFGPANAPWLFVTSLILDDEQNILGTLTIASEPTLLLRNLLSPAYSYLAMNFSLVTREGLIFTSSAPGFVMATLEPLSENMLKTLMSEKEIQQTTIRSLSLHPLDLEGFTDFFQIKVKDSTRLGTLLPIRGSDLRFLITISRDLLFAPFDRSLFYSLFLLALAAIVTSFSIGLLIKRLSKPLKQLSELMTQVAAGNWRARFIKDEVGYEINKVGEAINHMMDNLLTQMETENSAQIKQEMLSKEIKIGHQIQERILPRDIPTIAGMSIATLAKPALEVGGDFYDIFQQEGSDKKKKILFTIADTSSKGISACLYALYLRSMLRGFAVSSPDFGSFIKNANNLFCLDTKGGEVFVTVFAALLDLDTKQLTYYAAGHVPALVKHKDGSIEKLWTAGTPLGIAPCDIILQKNTPLQEGDTLLLYTDGITEAMNKQGELFGEERLIKFLSLSNAKDAEQLIKELKESLETFSSGVEQQDDITAVALKIGSPEKLVS